MTRIFTHLLIGLQLISIGILPRILSSTHDDSILNFEFIWFGLGLGWLFSTAYLNLRKKQKKFFSLTYLFLALFNSLILIKVVLSPENWNRHFTLPHLVFHEWQIFIFPFLLSIFTLSYAFSHRVLRSTVQKKIAQTKSKLKIGVKTRKHENYKK